MKIIVGEIYQYEKGTPKFLVTDIDGTVMTCLKEVQEGHYYQTVYIDYAQHALPEMISLEESIEFRKCLRDYLFNALSIQQQVNMII